MTLEKLQARINQLVEDKKKRGLPIDGEVFIRIQTPYYNRTKSKFYTFPFVESGITIASGQTSVATISACSADEVNS
jgi:hypothetical protein